MSHTTATDPADFLIVILDLNPLAWSDGQDQNQLPGSTLISAIESFLVFVNAHLALRHENAIAVYGATLGQSELLYSSLRPNLNFHKSSNSQRNPSIYQTFRVIDDAIHQGVKRLSKSALDGLSLGKNVGIVGALAKALCHINQVKVQDSKQKTSLRSRVLILSISGDAPGQYIPMMSCIFSAQKASIPIDVCKISGEEAVFMQQAAHLTDGIFYRIEKVDALIQYLMMIFLPGLAARKLLNLPHQDEFDLRAACFCHRKIIDIGYVCSVCLSIFCAPTPVCSTCRTKFPMATLKRFAIARPRPKPTLSNSNQNLPSLSVVQ